MQDEKTKAEKIQFVEMKKEPPKPKPKEPPPPKEVVDEAAAAEGIPGVFARRSKIPIKIPDIDLSKKVTDEADFSGKGVKGGIAKGVVGGTGVADHQPDLLRVPGREAGRPDPGHRLAALSDALRSLRHRG